MILFTPSVRADSALPLRASAVVMGRRRCAACLSRWAASAGLDKAERDRSHAGLAAARRNPLIGKGLRVLPGSGRDDAPPPPLRFARPGGEGPELLPPRKMGDPQGGAGGISAH